MNLSTVTFERALQVALRMREWDKKEIYATRWHNDPAALARDCARCGTFGWIAEKDGVPVSVIGAVPVHPGVWSVFMFATDSFQQISLSLTKFVKRVIIPALKATGAHRAECLSLAGHVEAHRWLELLGAHREGEKRAFGKGGEDFVSFVWSR